MYMRIRETTNQLNLALVVFWATYFRIDQRNFLNMQNIYIFIYIQQGILVPSTGRLNYIV